MVNENIVKIIGSVNIPNELELDHDYDIKARVSCIKQEKTTNNNGTYNLTHRLELLGDLDILGDNGVKTVGKSTKSQSKKLRDVLFMKYDEYKHIYKSSEDFYNAVTGSLIANIDEVTDYLLKL